MLFQQAWIRKTALPVQGNANNMPKVRVFSTPACPYCFTLKEFLKGRNIEFEDVDVSKDEKEREEMVKKTGKLEVPVVEVGDKFVVSFDKKKICQLLGIEE